MSSPFQKKFCGKTPNPIKMLGDLNKDGKMSSYEQTRQDAIEDNSPNNYGSPLEKEIDPKLAVKMAEKTKQLGKYRDYVERKEKGYIDAEVQKYEDITGSKVQPDYGFIKGDPSKTVSFDRYVMSKEIAKGGKSGSKAVKHFYENKPQYSGYLSEDKRQGVKKGLNIK
jgi:hypothetical protein